MVVVMERFTLGLGFKYLVFIPYGAWKWYTMFMVYGGGGLFLW